MYIWAYNHKEIGLAEGVWRLVLNVTVSPQTVPRAPYVKTPNTVRRRTAEDDAYEQAEIRRLVATHTTPRAKSPTPHYIPGSAHRRDPEFWE
ncbi:hypothetical protein EDB83DRAFT_2535701 [Lactarius deliciosus]|nr:hypothetical protein EDB83DRAFT_2535701 [Lactarius deliciosus]